MTDEEPQWLDATERRAWMSLVAVMLVAMPELERTFRPHGIVHVEYGLLAALGDIGDPGMRLSDLAHVTEKGRAFVATIAPDHVRDVRRLFFDNLSPQQTEALADALATIAEHLSGCTVESGAALPKRPGFTGAPAE